MKFFKVLVLILLPFSMYSQTENKLRYEINDLLKQQNLTGAIWSMVSDNEEIIVNSSGLKNSETNEALKPTNAIQVGSITKSVLSMGILRLATENKLSIDDNIQKYVPELEFNNPWEKTNPITIRHLLDHTSGISDLAIWHFFSTTSKPDTPLINAFYNNDKLLAVHTKPGTIFSYSNMGFSILGMVIEKVTGRRYEDYLDEKLLSPLGMNNSSFQFISQIGNEANENLAFGHFENGKIVASAPIYLRPAAQFTTTAYDMGLFLKFIMGDGTINKIPFVNSMYLKQLGTSEGTIAAQNGLVNGYSFGVQKKDWNGRVSLSHSGNIIGYKAYYYIFPKEKKALFVSYNIDHESADYSKINQLLIDHLKLPMNKPLEEALAVKTEEKLKLWNGYYLPIFSKVTSFRLLDYLTGFTKVTVNDNGADIMPFQKKVRNLNYTGDNLFRSNKRIMPSHLFYKDKQGSFFITTGTSSIEKTNGAIIIFVITSFVLGISGLLYLLAIGTIQLIKYKKGFLRSPLLWSYSSVIVLLLAIILIVLQPFMHIGNLTVGSTLLAISSISLPLFSFFSMILLLKNKLKNIKSFKFWSLIALVQFFVLLSCFGMIPLTLWN